LVLELEDENVVMLNKRNVIKIPVKISNLPSRSRFHASNFCTLPVSLYHVYIRIYGSRPFTLNECQGRGLDKISLTVPWERLSTASPKTRWPIL
jgi:hypothetical protein